MSKILGIDISSNSTGLGLIEQDKLLDYTKINPTGTMSNSAKMYLFLVELEKLISRYSPDYIGIEDVIQVSSVSVTKILARFNGIAIISAYKYNKKDPKLFVPSEWKKMIGLSGSVKKCETQLFVCNKYRLLSDEKIDQYAVKIKANFDNKNDQSVLLKKKNIELLKKKKKKEKDKNIIESIEKEIVLINSEIAELKKVLSKQINNVFDNLSMEIYVETGINEDIADAVGISIAYQKLLNETK
jgi:Holliday junction resolvasome RuvABC endonuclease subunit